MKELTVERMLVEILDRGDIRITRRDLSYGQSIVLTFRRRTDGKDYQIAKAMTDLERHNEWVMLEAIAQAHDRLT